MLDTYLYNYTSTPRHIGLAPWYDKYSSIYIKSIFSDHKHDEKEGHQWAKIGDYSEVR